MEQKCQRCRHEWEYFGKKGKAKYPEFITCPRCKTSVKLNNSKHL